VTAKKHAIFRLDMQKSAHELLQSGRAHIYNFWVTDIRVQRAGEAKCLETEKKGLRRGRWELEEAGNDLLYIEGYRGTWHRGTLRERMRVDSLSFTYLRYIC
jgi:hypothetical protein